MDVFECPFSLYGRKIGKEIALVTLDKEWTYLECNQLIEGTASILKKYGVKRGDPVALWPTKSFPTPLLFFALFRIGAIACPLNTYNPLTNLSEKLDALGTSFVIHPDDVCISKIKQICLPFSKVVKQEKPESQAFLHKDAAATYLFTSGTTANPKIACHSLGNHYYSALGSNAYLPIEVGDRYLLSLPLYHIGGIALLFRTFLAGATVALSEEIPGITHTSFVGTQLKRLLEKDRIPRYKHILLGGGPIPFSLYQNALAAGLPIHPTYGMTEMSSQIATLFTPGPFSLGHPLPYRELKIASDGEILVKGKTLFKGYLQPDGSFSLPLNQEGYFATSDLGSYSPKAGLSVQGRKDRLFISGGENIQPEEIEKLIRNLDGITYVQVTSTPDADFGFRPIAFIESEKNYGDEELKHYLSSFLPKFKVPVKFLPAADRPRTHKE